MPIYDRHGDKDAYVWHHCHSLMGTDEQPEIAQRDYVLYAKSL